jgi:NADH dehydrogenase [ubiquinone] 1 alpha subcomplex assembly factor 7
MSISPRSATQRAKPARGSTARVAQATFLETLGIRTRAALLSAKAGEEDRAVIAQAMTRLIDPRQMGSLFKALAIAHPDLQELAGFP